MRLTAVIFDWAGTVIDHGSRAPASALQSVFDSAGVPVSVAEARLSMGIAKRDHIRAILDLPRVAEAWMGRHGITPDEAVVDSLYKEFLPRQTQFLGERSRLIAGIPNMVEALRSRGLRIGSTTGYTRPMLEYLLEEAREQGFTPDCAIVPGDVPGGGRPAPWMCYLNAIHLAVSPLWSMVKIGDTPSDVEEGLNAGMWTIGVTRTGNEVGLTEDEWEATGAAQKAKLLAGAGRRLTAAGAHYVLESAAECLDVLSEIDDRMRAGERP